MSKFTMLCGVLAIGLACAHAEPPQAAKERDWEAGLDPEKQPAQIAPLGPLENDQYAYDFIRRREREHALGTKATASDIDEIINNSSQVLASALALPLFRAGVYLGSPRLIEKACTAGGRVTNSALRASGNVEAALQGCSALTIGKATNDGCGDGQAKLREAYGLLAAEKAQDAGHTAADAVRMLRDRCPKMGAPLRSPVDPSTKGFLIVWVLHANDAPPVTFLAGETAPNTAEAINDGFLRGVQAIRSLNPQPISRGEIHAQRTP